MKSKEYYELHKHELLKPLYEAGYTPHELAVEAYKEGMSIYDYIILLNEI
jgi:hypothetical protein